jgi:hypothetical protein
MIFWVEAENDFIANTGELFVEGRSGTFEKKKKSWEVLTYDSIG